MKTGDKAFINPKIIGLSSWIEDINIKTKNEISTFENKLIQKGLNDFTYGNISTHEEVKARFIRKFAK